MTAFSTCSINPRPVQSTPNSRPRSQETRQSPPKRKKVKHGQNATGHYNYSQLKEEIVSAGQSGGAPLGFPFWKSVSLINTGTTGSVRCNYPPTSDNDTPFFLISFLWRLNFRVWKPTCIYLKEIISGLKTFLFVPLLRANFSVGIWPIFHKNVSRVNPYIICLLGHLQQ